MSRRRLRMVALARASTAVVLGLVAGIPVGFAIDLAAGFLVGWSVAALLYSISALGYTWRMDAERTMAHARSEAPGRTLARVVSVLGGLASLVAVGLVLIKAQDAPTALKAVLAGICVIAVVASWLIIQVDYLLRIAAEYYADPVGGIDFNQKERPMYSDFAYFAFNIGITYQVSDNDVLVNRIRRLVLAQSLLGYFFGAVILATIINLVSGLGSG